MAIFILLSEYLYTIYTVCGVGGTFPALNLSETRLRKRRGRDARRYVGVASDRG